MKSLGIDLGSNSLGWAILDDNDIVAQGVVIFDEGIIRQKGVDSLETPAAQRRKHRMARRLKFRRKLRKLQVLKILIENGMCPLSIEEWQQIKATGRIPDNPAYREWLKSVPSSLTDHVNPYYARAMAAERKVEPLLVGRALYHLAQRRGFKSSRKDLQAGEEENSERAKDLGIVKKEIAELTLELEARNCTLGQYFYQLNQTGSKIRKRHTSRVEHYQKEFEKIAEIQEFSPELKEALNDALFSQRPLRSQKHLVGKCPLEKNRSRCLIGHPLFELYRMYAFINTIKLDDGSGLRNLTSEERKKVESAFFRKERSFEFEKIIKCLYPEYKSKKQTSFPVTFNYRADRDVPSCRVAHQLNGLLGMDFLQWEKQRIIDGRETRLDYQTIFDALVFYDDNDLLREFGKNTLGLSDEQASMLVKLVIPDGYANYSLCAIRRILPFLKLGIELSTATLLGKVPVILGNEKFLANSSKIIGDILAVVSDFRNEIHSSVSAVKTIPLNVRLRGYLEDEWKLSPAQVDQLYWETGAYSASDDCGHTRTLLGKVELGMIKNPLVQRSMTILRRLVNDLCKSGKIDEFTQINIELARNVNDRNRRMAWETWQQQKNLERKKAAEELRPLLGGADAGEELIDKYILREEQGGICIYTGRPIELSDLVSANSSFDIEHTVPRSRSGDNSMANKTLCDASYNRNLKKGCLPTECSNYDAEIAVRIRPWVEKRDKLRDLYQSQLKASKRVDPSAPERKATARQKALVTELELRYWEKKVSYFEVTAENMENGFMNRQLVDTGVMTRHAVEFLRSVYPKTYPVNGIAVAWARKCWGIQEQYSNKERIDHTHHVLDAIVIAALDRKRFQEICSLFRDDGDTAYNFSSKEVYARLAPFAGFAGKAYAAVEKVCVKFLTRHNEFKQTWRKSTVLPHPHRLPDGTLLRKVAACGDTVRGQLHGETFYGLIESPEKKEKKFVVRKFISDNLTFKSVSDFSKIVDSGVRRAVTAQVEAYMAEGMAFKNAIASPLWMKKPDADGKGGVPVIKVRIYADSVTEPHRLRKHLMPSEIEYKNYYYVNSTQGSNFRMALFLKEKKVKGQMSEYWDLEIDNILTHAKNLKNPEYISFEERSDGKFLGYINQGCAVLKYENNPEELKGLSSEELQKRLYYLVKFEKNGRVTLRYHREARDNKSLQEFLISQGKSKTGESNFKFDEKQELLLISSGKFKEHLLFEGIHFQLSLDGEIIFL